MKTVLFFLITLSFFGCSEISILLPRREKMQFVVINESQNKIEWVKVLISDYVKNGFSNNTYSQVLQFDNIKENSRSDFLTLNFKDYSKKGSGSVKILTKAQNKSDTLIGFAASYVNFRISEDLSLNKDWFTTKITISDITTANQEIKVCLCKFKNGIELDSNCK